MKRIDIEKLLQWAYLDELCKGGSTTNNQWDLLVLVGAGRGEGLRRLPPIFGDPHPDAVTLNRVVQGLPAPAPALLQQHATMQTRPNWHPEPLRLRPVISNNGQPQVVGTCKRKNVYSDGSYCPLRQIPSDDDLRLARLHYEIWWSALVVLAGSLRLRECVAVGPSAPREPWLDATVAPRVLRSQMRA